jgi:hypothetical protein
VRFYFDPVCPFAWMTSKWVRRVAALRDVEVDWRFISLVMVNEEKYADGRLSPERRAGHEVGLRLLRVAARARAEHGRDAVGRLYLAFGEQTFERLPGPGSDDRARDVAFAALTELALPEELLKAMDDDALDGVIRQETEEALALAGKELGTPILQFQPPDGPAFFGPVISRMPEDGAALELWDHVTALAVFPGFAELKRSLREAVDLPALTR